MITYVLLGIVGVLSIASIIINISLYKKNITLGQNGDFRAIIDNIKQTNFDSYKLILSSINDSEIRTQNTITNNTGLQKMEFESIQKKVDDLTERNEKKIEKLTMDVNESLKQIRESNEKKLEMMRATVDEKLNVSLSQRLNDSFSKIQQSMESVGTRLGEMKALETNVTDLKIMLGNVKRRGVWGEVTLNNLLEQMLSPYQYKANVQVKNNTSERVDFVVVMPGKDDKDIFLPIDSKFPLEDYYKLSEASERTDVENIEKYQKALSKRIKEEAKKIHEKYINLPITTDFGVLFLPIEGLYAEVVKDVSLIEFIQTKYKVMVCGPTTLAAFLNSLQMGFKTMYIEKRSSELWRLLATFKTEFEKFVQLLLKTQNKLSDANISIEQATTSSRKIAKKLGDVTHIVGLDFVENDTLPITDNGESDSDDEGSQD
ncbi:MAG: DNA recombination protein RmuC [Clostridia bacterium]|nr:DNA recombination protein RmuC [Clostridia bacterium]